MSDYIYTYVTGQLRPLLEKMQQTGKPSQADKKWLASIGFASPKAATLLPILKGIGFIDDNNKPTDAWLAYRDKNRSKTILAEGVRKAYSELFETYPDACEQSDDHLRSYFASKTSAGQDVVNKMVLTFKALCSLADFTTGPLVSHSPNGHTEPAKVMQSPQSLQRVAHELAAGVTININVQLALPESTDPAVYDNFFSAMKRHLLTPQSRGD